MNVIRMPLPKRDCYGCFDFERSGPNKCVVCERPIGARLPEAERPPAEAKWWIEALGE